ncbi:farnesyl pyrophosphate synthetase [Enterococcus sp. JM4C]|uniref:polyprenyl synthetase family protein n=1 Tax=Candidatus Enterococcus huntleyi TaxID=1857217 RepID=UPI0013794878|nr:polyprenyl synthetase family protein [Enterococcus sp. JM4C]KAF1295606.1 farnesyl pyrophosphate synthetase [Enterococcus sp. JM4C]
MLDYWNNYPTIQEKLKAVCSTIESQVQVRNQEIQEALTNLAQAGGKMLRPALFLLFSEVGDSTKQDQEQLIKVAASLEILHMATLIHDDIIDDSPLRRGIITVQAEYGKDVAVYTGDLLFTVFFDLLSDAMNGSEFLHTNARAMRRLLLGELDQMQVRFDQNQTLNDYLRSINGKTAELFWLSCIEGAHFGKCSPETQQLAGRIGRNIGVAFQVYDDILDYVADSEQLKKPVLEDLAQGVYTLPLLLAKEDHPEVFAPYLDKKAAITVEEAQKVSALVLEYDGVDKAKEFALEFTEKALDEIDLLPDSPGKTMIKQLTSELLGREY